MSYHIFRLHSKIKDFKENKSLPEIDYCLIQALINFVFNILFLDIFCTLVLNLSPSSLSPLISVLSSLIPNGFVVLLDLSRSNYSIHTSSSYNYEE